MFVKKATNLACPIDGLPFDIAEKQLRCPNGHSFDIARQGHINLLLVQQKRSRHPGDSKAMVTARTAFLQTGVYAPIAEKLVEIVLQQFASEPEIHDEYCLLDAGCGEGYYLDYLLHALAPRLERRVAFIGLDISKPAIMAAAKRNKQISWLVAANKQPSVMAETVDIIFSIFGFPDFGSFKHLLKPGGKIILVDAGSEHLIELRQIIYPEVKKSPPPGISEAEALGFSLQDSTDLHYQTGALPQRQIMDLLTMTPHLYRATLEGKQAAAALEKMDLSVDVHFRVLVKNQN